MLKAIFKILKFLANIIASNIRSKCNASCLAAKIASLASNS